MKCLKIYTRDLEFSQHQRMKAKDSVYNLKVLSNNYIAIIYIYKKYLSLCEYICYYMCTEKGFQLRILLMNSVKCRTIHEIIMFYCLNWTFKNNKIIQRICWNENESFLIML